MNIRLKLAIILGVIAGALLFGGLASAHTVPVIPGATCSQSGQLGTHNGQTYRCEKHLGEVCESWHWLYSSNVPKSGKTAWPHPTCPCESTSPTASPTPSHTPTATPTPTGSAVVVTTPSTAPSKTGSAQPTPVADTTTLPVTGSPVVGYATVGLSSLTGGVMLLVAARRRRAARQGGGS